MSRLALIFLATLALAATASAQATGNSTEPAEKPATPSCLPAMVDLSAQRIRGEGSSEPDGVKMIVYGAGKGGQFGLYSQHLVYYLQRTKPLTDGHIQVNGFSRVMPGGQDLSAYFTLDPVKATVSLKPKGRKAFIDFVKGNKELVLVLATSTAEYENVYSFDHLLVYTERCP